MESRIYFLFFLLVGISCGEQMHRKTIAPTSPVVNVMEGSRTFWNKRAENIITSKLNMKLNMNKAKNVIFFIGDGMSVATVSAARMYMGNEETELSFDTFPHYGLAKTYCVDVQVADSACSAVAFLAGVKSNNRLLGLNANVLSRQCVVHKEDHVDSIISWAQKSNKATGIVTTTRITHATPAGAYAHVAHRDWEHNNAITTACRAFENVTDIAHQLVHNEVSKNLKVILGGGRRGFINSTVLDDEGRPGLRTDGRNLIDEWLSERRKSGEAKYVWHKQQLDEIDVKKTDYLMGLFESDHCMYNLDILNNNLQHQEPSLTDMTAKAIKMLQKDENGFFLFVEGGRIDHAHHSTRPQRALEETKEFARAIDVARQMTNEEDTLIVVSADHSHVMTYNGYPNRGKNILGIGDISDEDFKPYQTLSYANGPGHSTTYNADGSRIDISSVDLKNPERRASATVPRSSESHAGEDISVYASGPWSHLFVGSYEQNNIPLLMAHAAKIGPYAEASNENNTSTDQPSTTTGTAKSYIASHIILISGLIIVFAVFISH
jgi:alkaline phosphatase